VSYLFNAGSSHHLSASNTINVADFPLTIMGWIKVAALPGSNNAIFGVSSSSVNDIYICSQLNSSGAILVETRNTSGAPAATSPSTISADTWSFFTHEMSGEGSWNMNLRRAAALFGSFDTNNFAGTYDVSGYNRMSIGRLPRSTADRYFSGRVAHLAIVSKVPSAEEYTALQTQTPSQVFSANRVHYWPLTDNPNDAWGSVNLTATGASLDSDNPDIGMSRFLKILVHPDAASASAVEGIVWQAGGIASTEIGEFTGKTFEATTEGSGDAERAVLLVPVADFGGGSLSVDDVVPCLVRNATYTTGIITGTVIEE
jgi:hypothetical protein